jgi:YVTN family beta-propeller protein
VYVGLENQDAVAAIDTVSNKVLATIAVGQQPQALVYVPGAVPDGSDAAANLMPLGAAGNAAHLVMAAPDGGGDARATVSVNALGAVDLLQVAASGLKPGDSYTLWLVTSRTPPFGKKESLATFKANAAGAQIVQTIGPLRQVLTHASDAGDVAEQRFLMVSPADSDMPVLVQDAR